MPTSRRERIGVPFMVVCGAVTVNAARGTGRSIAVGVLFAAAEACFLAFRRVPPWAAKVAVIVAAGVALAVMLLAPSGLGEVPVLVASGHVPAVFEGRDRMTVVVVTLGVAFGAVVWAISGSPVGILAGVGVFFFAERSVEQRALAVERDRAVALLAEVEASRDAQARAAAGEERGRIARDMHDVLAHSLAGLSLQIQAVRAVAAREGVGPEITGPLERAAALARAGVEEARSVVGALRPTDVLGIDAVDGLVARFPGRADVVVEGGRRPVDPAAGHAVYRAVQESLTNAARYATGAPVTVALCWSDVALVVRVSDGGVPEGHSASGIKGSGSGLSGMAERIAAVGGTVHSGPHGPGWLVEMSVPVLQGAEADQFDEPDRPEGGDRPQERR